MVTKAKPKPGVKPPSPTVSHTTEVQFHSPADRAAGAAAGAPAPQPLVPPAPGTSNPMTHPQHPAMQSSMGGDAAAAAGGGVKQSQLLPTQNPNPSGDPQGIITPNPTSDVRQVRQNIQFKDMQPVEQAQVAEQQGLDPYAPLKMVQQGATAALAQGGSTGPVPNMLSGPYVPPGIEAFPDDMAHLTQLMGQGYAPGASPQEHQFGLNAHALANAKLNQAFSQAQQAGGSPTPDPYAASQPQTGPPPGVTLAAGIPNIGDPSNAMPPPQGAQPPMSGPPPAPPMAPGATPPLPPGVNPPGTAQGTMPGAGPGAIPPPGPPPGMPPPQLGSGMGGPPPTQPGAPGGIPPALIAALLAKRKQAGAMR